MAKCGGEKRRVVVRDAFCACGKKEVWFYTNCVTFKAKNHKHRKGSLDAQNWYIQYFRPPAAAAVVIMNDSTTIEKTNLLLQ